MFDGTEMSFGLSYRELRKNEGSRKWDSTVIHLRGSTSIFLLGTVLYIAPFFFIGQKGPIVSSLIIISYNYARIT